MSRFAAVDQEVAFRGAANIDVVSTIPIDLLRQDRERWYEKIADKDRPIETTRSLAALGYDIATKTEMLGSLAIAVTAHVPTHILAADRRVARMLRKLSADHALSRLMGVLIEEDRTYVDSRGNDLLKAAETDDRFLIDAGEEPLPMGAHGITVPRAYLGHDPYPGVVPRGATDESWFHSPHDGLYVAVMSPPRVSQEFMENLYRQVGGDERAAAAMLDAPNSATLYPYVSLEYLDEAARS